jgi:hypothetical protein
VNRRLSPPLTQDEASLLDRLVLAGESFGHKLLVCRLLAITFPDECTCRLHLHEGHCTDMSGAIKVAKSITRHLIGFKLRRVETIAADEDDTCYLLKDTGEWVHLVRRRRDRRGNS